jgi:hypothetical protein
VGAGRCGRQLAAGQVRVTNVFGRPAIVIAPDAGAHAAGLFMQSWNQLAMGPSLTIHAADEPKADFPAVSLKYLGAKPALSMFSPAPTGAPLSISARWPSMAAVRRRW